MSNEGHFSHSQESLINRKRTNFFSFRLQFGRGEAFARSAFALRGYRRTGAGQDATTKGGRFRACRSLKELAHDLNLN
ncbi:hypothetical protein [Nitrobacter winogradskyi]|uniref:hypothetical protein n=1 Tax=Nitrobacter winogradskyi TaxID=913 RepID=UPI00030A47B8|nr:hypothetical protein [Nitrobacter winogradskyi]